MPPPPPDRKDLYRDGRRNDGGGGDPLTPAAPTPPRWRDSPYHPPPPPLRDHSRPSPRRTPSSASSEGYYRQGGGAYERSYPDEPLGYTPSRSDRYWLDDDGGGYKGFGRYGGGGRRDGRDMRGSYRRSPFRSYGGDFSRSHQEHPPPPLRRSPLRSVAVPICYDPPGDRVDRGDRDHHPRVTPWRPLQRRESRSDAADAAGAGPVSVGQTASASEEEVPAQSLAVAAPQMSEDETPRKKARLGWGQGLAKYEKQKVQGSAEPAEAIADGSPANAEHKASLPAPASVLCASPVTCPSPAPPCSYPVCEDKSCELTANTVTESHKDVPGPEVQACNDEVPIKLDQFDGDPIGSLADVLAELLQHEDSCSGDSKRLTGTSKLLLLKESITKELEKTELEIDSLEGELKSVNTEAGNRALKGSPAVVTCARSPSPSNGTSKVPVSTCETTSPGKEQGELTPSPKITVEQDADVNGVELMEVETAPVHNVKTVSSEESVACPGVADAQISAAADVVPLKPWEGIESQNKFDSERQEANSCHDNVNSMKADGSDDLSMRPCSYHDDNYNIIPSIIAANNAVAKEASELVFKPLSADRTHLDLLASSHLSSQRKNDLIIKEKLAIRENRLRLKEQILTFKFKVLRHLWKEDVRLLSVRKLRSKSNKRADQGNRASQSGSQKQRSSNRSRLAMPAGNLSTFPIMEISDIANKLFSEFQVKRCRNYLKMPAVIIDEKEKAGARFISKNALIDDPVSVEKERAMINPWTQDEKEVFMEMLARFGKDFSKISSFLQHKTTADCVEFYYKHHKSDSFREVKKLLDLRQQQQPTSNYLGTKSGKKWNPEANAASLDMLGVASVVAAHGLDYASRVEKNSSKSIIRTAYGSDIPFVTKGSTDKECVGNVPLHERESVAADVLAGICGTLSPEGMDSCITSSADPGQKISITRMEHLLTPEVDKSFGEEGTLSDQECEVDPVDWNDNEKSIFIEAMNNYGKDFAQISSCVKSKSYEQCKVFFSKARKSLGLDLIHQGTVDVGLPKSDTNGGRSDTDEACAAEMDSAICSARSCSKMEMDVCPAVDGAIQGHPLSGITSKQPEADDSNGPDVVDVKVEEGEIKADKNCNILEADDSNGPDVVDVKVEEGEIKADKSCNILEADDSNGPDVVDVKVEEGEIKADKNCNILEADDSNGPDVVDVKVEEGEIKTDKNCNILVDHKWVSEATHQASCAPIDINHPESTENAQNIEDVNLVNMHGNGAMASSTEQAAAADMEIRSSLHSVEVIQSSKTSEAICSEVSRMEGSSHRAPESALMKSGNSTPSVCLPAEGGSKESVLHFSNMAGVSSIRPAFTSSYQHTMPADLLPSKPKPQVTPLTPKDLMPVQFSSALPDPTSIRFEGIASMTTPNFEDHGKEVGNASGAKDKNKFPTYKGQSGNQLDGLVHNIDGCMQQRRNHHLATEVPIFSESTASRTLGISQSDQFALAKFQNGWSSGSSLSNATAGILWTGNGVDVREGSLRPCSHKASAESDEQQRRPGDVKLFGQILSHQSSLQSSGSSSNGSKSKAPSPKIDRSASRLLNSSRDHLVHSSRPAITAHLGLEERAVRSYAHLDGSTVQPEPMLMVAKCQRSLAGVPFYSAKNGTLGVFTEYQQPLRQQFPSTVFQQPGKGSRLGGTGILVSGVSDPVVALKAQYGPGSKILSNDVDPWKDIGSSSILASFTCQQCCRFARARGVSHVVHRLTRCLSVGLCLSVYAETSQIIVIWDAESHLLPCSTLAASATDYGV